ncbi:MAG: TMEM175 family protein [Streptosporangiaceae bacterium]
MPDDEVETDSRAAERLTFFSDAVVAIAITLLAIDLPVPGGGTVSAFWLSVEHDDGHYAAFLISFAVIAAAWSDHHELFAYARRVDARLRTLNTWWLLSIVLNPFATRLLVASGQNLPTHALRFGFYALLQVMESAMEYALLRHMIARRLANVPAPVAASLARKSYALMIGFGLSIPVFFVVPWAWVLWIASPVLGAQLRRQRRRRVKSDPPPRG